MKKYIFIVGLVLAIGIKQYIDPAPTGYTHGYLSTSQRTDSLAQYCADSQICSFMPFQYGWSNRLRLQAIQYIGTDVYATYHPDLYARLSDVTTLDRQRSYPYIFGQHLLPQEDNAVAIQQTILLGEKGISGLCDSEKISVIASLSDQQFLDMYYSTDPIVPCENYSIPQSIGFVSFYYAKDIPRAIMYYRIAALAYDAPDTLVDMPAIITARYDDDRKSMMMWESRYQSAQYQLNPELNDTDLFFLLSTMEHALRKAVHHGFVSLIQEVSGSHNCEQSIDCVREHMNPTIEYYNSLCNTGDDTEQVICRLLLYAQEQGWVNRQGKFIYPLDVSTPDYGRRPDLERRDVMPQ